MIPPVSGVYTITNLVTKRVYVGSTRFFHGRKINHVTALQRGDHSNKLLQRDWNLFGADCFEFQVVRKVDTGKVNKNRNILYMLEQKILDKFEKVYNAKRACGFWRYETKGN